MTQRGNIYVYSAIAIVLLALMVASIYRVTSAISAADAKGYKRGVGETTAAFTERDNKQLQAVIIERDAALTKVRELEHQHDVEITAAEDAHVEEVGNINSEHDRVLTRLRRERDEARARAAGAGDDPGTAPAADPGGCPRPDWRRIIPNEDGAALVGEAARGDKIIAKLNECRAVLEIIEGK